MEFNISGKISFDVDLDIEATSEDEAISIAIKQLTEYYRLNVKGADIVPESLVINLDVNEYED